MLQRFGRWLRAAGYDTEIINDGRGDYDVLKQARKENRILLTCDQALTKYRGADKNVVLLETGSLDELVEQVSQKYQLDWQYQPLTRCMTCNSLLKEADEEQRKSIPADIKLNKNSHDVYYCPRCNKVYWDGDHVKRMHAQLEQWQAAYN